jgi:hypothetical protein
MVLPKDDSMREPRCTDEHHGALKHAERKARTYRKAVLGLAGLLLLSLSGNLASTALTILVFTESRRSADAIPQRPVVLSDSKAAALVGTSLLTSVKDTPDPPPVSVPGLKRCAVAPSGAEACWELADPAMTTIPDGFLEGNTNLTGTLRVGPAVKTVGARAFFGTKLASLDLSEATSLVEIGRCALYGTDLTGLDLSEATSLVEIGDGAFSNTDLGGTLVIPAKLATIGPSAFGYTKLTGLDLSEATSLVEIGDDAFFEFEETTAALAAARS